MSINQRKENYLSRFNGLNLSKDQLERQWRVRQEEEEAMRIAEAINAQLATQQALAVGAAAAGGGRASGSIEFVVDTTNGTYFGMSFVSTGEPITFTIDWGDGEIEEGSGYGGYYEEEHEFPEENTQYTVKMTFDDPAKILELNFYGND